MATRLKTAEPDDIENAVLSGGNILYPGLSGYIVAYDPSTSLPLTYPGGFCMGVKLYKPGASDKCLRCWWKEIKGEKDVLGRLRNTAASLRRRSTTLGEYFLNFEVVDNLLRVNGDVIPGVVMDWANGETLNSYLLDTNRHSSKDLKALAENFRTMCSRMSEQGVAHGDLSGPNIIVRDNKPVLVDYDSMYFKEDGRRDKTIDGTPSFQHPGRGSHPYMELCCDNFSHHIIYVTLLILAELPEAREKVDPKQELYFDREDTLSAKDFETSPNVKKARNLGNPAINSELDIIQRALRGTYMEVPPLKNNSGNTSSSSKRMVEYCTNCGHKFGPQETDFKYCTDCGSSRLIYA